MGRVEVTYSKRATLVTAIEVGSWYLKFRCIEAEVVDVVGEQGRRSRNVSTGVFSDKMRLREPTQLCVRDYQRISNSKSFNLYPLLSRASNAITFHPMLFRTHLLSTSYQFCMQHRLESSMTSFSPSILGYGTIRPGYNRDGCFKSASFPCHEVVSL